MLATPPFRQKFPEQLPIPRGGDINALVHEMMLQSGEFVGVFMATRGGERDSFVGENFGTAEDGTTTCVLTHALLDGHGDFYYRIADEVERRDLRRRFDHVAFFTPHVLRPDFVFSMRRLNGVQLWDYPILALRFATSIERLSSHFNSFKPFLKTLAESARSALSGALSPMRELPTIPPGRASFREYERLVETTLRELWTPPLVAGAQVWDRERANRRDLIFTNHANSGFWRSMRDFYDAHYVVVEAKNEAKPASKAAVTQLANYLQPRGARRFGIVVSRAGLSAGAAHAQRRYWSGHEQLLILGLSDRDLCEMALRAHLGQAYEVPLLERLRALRLGL